MNIINNNNNIKYNKPKISKTFNNDKICYYYNILFQSKYNMERHILQIHEKLYFQKCEFCGGHFNNIFNHQKTCIENINKLELFEHNNSLLNQKRINESKHQEDDLKHTKSNNNSYLLIQLKIGKKSPKYITKKYI